MGTRKIRNRAARYIRMSRRNYPGRYLNSAWKRRATAIFKIQLKERPMGSIRFFRYGEDIDLTGNSDYSLGRDPFENQERQGEQAIRDEASRHEFTEYDRAMLLARNPHLREDPTGRKLVRNEDGTLVYRKKETLCQTTTTTNSSTATPAPKQSKMECSST